MTAIAATANFPQTEHRLLTYGTSAAATETKQSGAERAIAARIFTQELAQTGFETHLFR
jgi:hypothetical protein